MREQSNKRTKAVLKFEDNKFFQGENIDAQEQ